MDDVTREVVVEASPAEVWPALTDPGELSRWFGAAVALDARPGGRGVFRWPDGTERSAVVEAVEVAHRLAFRWLPFQRTETGEVVPVPATRVEITLEEVPEGTRVRVVERAAFARGGLGGRLAGGHGAAVPGASPEVRREGRWDTTAATPRQCDAASARWAAPRHGRSTRRGPAAGLRARALVGS
jgi:uncharacterized protein YndB with AHSA1/START domain